MRDQAYKPYKALIALLAALALCLFAACSSDDDGGDSDAGGDTGDAIPTEATGTYNATEYLATQINTALSSSTSTNSAMTLEDDTQNGDDSDDNGGLVSSDGISLTINGDNTVSISVDLSNMSMGTVTIPGTCVYSSSGNSFTFTLDYSSATATGSDGNSLDDTSLGYIKAAMSQFGPTILSQFNPAYYSNSALYNSSTISDSYKIFTKATD